jgi:F420-dependent methylenetetrahydromethanopterin dehydrogenase
MALGHNEQCACVDCMAERMRGGTSPMPPANAADTEIGQIVAAAESAEDITDARLQPDADVKDAHRWATVAAADELARHAQELRDRAAELDKLVEFLRSFVDHKPDEESVTP